MSPLEIAVAMYQREHDRWNQWALFFFGSIVSVFVAWGQIAQVVPLLFPAALSMVLSIMWVLVALSIRASTQAWRKTIHELERSTAAAPNQGDARLAFATFKKRYEQFNRLQDLGHTLALWRSEPYLRVTRLLTLIGVISVLVFAVLTVACLLGGPMYGCTTPNNRLQAAVDGLGGVRPGR